MHDCTLSLDILRSSDLDTITSKSVRRLLQQDTAEPLDEYKKELNALIMQCLDLVNDPPIKEEQQQQPTPPIKHSSIEQSTRPKSSPPPKAPRSNKKRTSEMIDSDDEGTKSNKKKKTSSTAAVAKKKKPVKKRNIDAATLQKNPFTKSWLLSDTLSNLTGEKAVRQTKRHRDGWTDSTIPLS
jgi:upstream activation factor subunit UAF30